MKKLSAIVCVSLCITLFSCNYGDDDTSLNYKDSDHYYSMNAHFNKRKTRDVEAYMNSRIGTAGNLSFTNVQSDATFTLDDHTTFYMKKSPGHVEIRLDKNENSEEAYHKIRSMCEGIKKVLTK